MKRKEGLPVYSLVCFLWFFACAGAGADTFRFVHYGVSHGLGSNSVRAIAEDDRGFLWFGTDNGLYRFDGYTFKPFYREPGDSAGPGCNYIYSLYRDRSGRLWAGTSDGVYLYVPEREQFRPLEVQTEKGVRIHTHITSISEDAEGNIWIASLVQGVFAYHAGTHTLRQYEEGAEDVRYRLSSNQICFLYIEDDGAIWAFSRQTGAAVNYRAPGSDRFGPYRTGEAPELSNVYAMAETDGYLWLGSWTDGLYRLHKPTGRVERYLVPGNNSGANHIHSLLAYEEGSLLVGSDDGLHHFDTSTGDGTPIAADRQRAGGLSDKFIYPIFRDREGGLWIGTYYGGVHYAPPRKGDIEGYAHSPHANSVGGNIISCFCEDTVGGNVWIGSDDGGLSCLDTQTGTFTRYMPSQGGRKGLSYHNIHALYLEGRSLWIGTYTGGLNVLDLNTGRFKWYGHDTNDVHSLDNSSIYSIHRDVDGHLWIGTMLGLLWYDRENDRFIRMKHTGYTVADILDDGRRNVWFATGGGGLYRYSLDTRQWTHYRQGENSGASLPSNEVNCLCLDRNDRLWIGTDRGLCTYGGDSAGFVHIPLQTPSSYICSIVEDSSYLWLATTHGLVRYLPDDRSCRILTQNDGLQSDQFMPNAALQASSGKMCLGTVNGFNAIDPRSITHSRYVPPVYITNLQLFNRDESIRSGGVLHRSIMYTDGIVLSSRQNMFSLEFASLSYSMPSKNQYMYRLEGFDKDWNRVQNQRKATYTNLPAGRYLFRVIASNGDGVWNSEGASLSIVVQPPFWRSLWAYLLYLSIVLGAAAFLLHTNRKRIERRHRQKMQQLHVEKEKEIHEARMKFFTFIAHEIRTPLSLIIGPLEKIMENSGSLPDSVGNALRTVERNSRRLYTLVNQLLDFQKAEQGAFTVQLACIPVYDLLCSIHQRFNPLVEQNGITFELHVSDPSIQATVDAEALTKIISNLLSNALKHARTKMSLSACIENHYLYIKVEDDGCGIPEKEQKKIFVPFYRVDHHLGGTGIGLSLVKLLVDAHQGMVEVESEPERGSVFTVTLPVCPDQAKACAAGLLDRTVKEVLPEKDPVSQEASTVPERDGNPNRPILLIVEDNSEMRAFLQRTFEQEYVILPAKHGKEGLEWLRQKTVDLIISDVMMPVMDGISFTQEVRKNILCSHIPIILLTAKTDNESKVAGIKAGADIYVEKPFSPQVLKAQIECLLASRRALRRKFSEMPFIPLNSIAGNKADELFLSGMNEIIEKNISNINFTIDTLAGQLCVSRSALFTKIRKQTDMTPNDLIRLIRLKKAAELLLRHEYRVNEICYRVGFTSPSYFSKCFQKQFGVLPKDFRESVGHSSITE
ncbi:MAG: response regulator [Tannerellaceae bacterium]|jgi:signal transduction histidine kinase/ligand-binding sensor domain-containing protein/DNA-binding response OmpR family regulator|nr:response regulator [Tannerellaceae bacterium]